MRIRISTLAPLAAIAAAACSTTPAQQEARSPKAEQELAEALQGRSVGPAVNCIPNLRGNSRMEVVDDFTILFRDGATVYVQNPRGGCPGIDGRGYTLVSRKVGSNQICSGDINQLVDLQTGTPGGVCVFGPFIPYRKV